MLQTLMNVTIVIFMVGNLLEVGLRLNVAEALAALRNARFVLLTIMWCIVLGPALAVLLTMIFRSVNRMPSAWCSWEWRRAPRLSR
jgi:BASS family bile acid:Na+ symporter